MRNYVMPWDEPHASTGPLSLELFSNFPKAVVTSPGGQTSLSVYGDDNYSRKRIAACIVALIMPDAGVDDNLESSIDRFNYYADQLSLPALPENPVSIGIPSAIRWVKQRPDMVLSD